MPCGENKNNNHIYKIRGDAWQKHEKLGFIIIRHELNFDRPVSASSNSLFKGLPSRLRPLGLQFSTIFGIPLLFILVTRRGQSDLYLPSFSSTGSTVNSYKISSLVLW